jgi:multicomponent Na+:H+ antiporter subunit E
MTSLEPEERTFWHAAGARGAMFLVLWAIFTLGNPADLPAGILTAVAATWVSLHLLPPTEARLSLLALTTFALRFFRQSVLAGVDVAWRALDPRLPLRTGFVTCPSQLPDGPARSAFCAIESLLPGTLPVGRDPSGALLIHCLDTDQPVVAQLAEDERLFRRVFGKERDDD